MKVERSIERNFNPYKITITIETEEDENLIKELHANISADNRTSCAEDKFVKNIVDNLK